MASLATFAVAWLDLPPARAQDRSAVHAEVLALLAIVEQGGCVFMRNGTWYTSADARKLLEHKMKQGMREPAGLVSAEHFIEHSASRSSMSGRPYMVRCSPDTQPVEAGPWLMNKLVQMRAAAAARPPGTPLR